MADYTITYQPHRIMVTAQSEPQVTVRYQFMPLYGPQEWFDFEPETLVSDAASEAGK